MVDFHIESERDLPKTKQKMGTYKAYFVDTKANKLLTIQFEALDPLCAKLKAKDIERDSNWRYKFCDWHKDCYGF